MTRASRNRPLELGVGITATIPMVAVVVWLFPQRIHDVMIGVVGLYWAVLGAYVAAAQIRDVRAGERLGRIEIRLVAVAAVVALAGLTLVALTVLPVVRR